MRRADILIVAVVAVLVAPLPLVARSDEAPMAMKQYWLGLIHRGPEWTSEVTEATRTLQAGHMANIGRLAETGQLVLAGPCGDDGDLRGLFIYDVATREEAEALVASDPAMAAGHLVVELHPWWGAALLAEIDWGEVPKGEEQDG